MNNDQTSQNANQDYQVGANMRILFRILDTFFAVLDFIRMIPWNIWYLLSCGYWLSIGRLIVYVQIKRNERKWQKFLKSL